MRNRAKKQQQLHTQQGYLLLCFFLAFFIGAFLLSRIDFEQDYTPFVPVPVYDTSSAFEAIKPIASSETIRDGTRSL